ncbi:hypothetical protein BDV93DRAFT_566550 [Ceratobasidium sp. AG-I]|nr:hypothetical protein BDV93DRAFT_566550 [Ceratobasidium sp. AG-I]
MLSEVDSAGSPTTNEDRMVYEELCAIFTPVYSTTNTTLLSFFVAMQIYPGTQSYAQEEALRTISNVTRSLIPGDVLNLERTCVIRI